ncbi:MAG: 5'/3'-nucleotidase SurE [Bacteroidaceae bacterium]|nr:5'/3'-nucleotidase SurE [Bacteroidaceae bacterium]
MTDIRKSTPLILITNDDGFDAKGIRTLTQIALQFAKVVVVAPDRPRSGQSGAITPHAPLYITELEKNDRLQSYSVNGTPTDCVKLAMHEILNEKPDLLLSGINHGSNAAISVLYSGTMGAVFEGCVQHIPSIGFSLCSHLPEADFSACDPIVEKITRLALQKTLPEGICLNINIPATEKPKGIKICKQAKGHWTEEFIKKTDENNRPAFFLSGYFQNEDPDDPATDEWALANNYVSIVPCHTDMTATASIPEIEKWLNP